MSAASGSIAGSCNGVLQARIADIPFDYQNEFLGTGVRLVLTPLADRAFLAMALAVGGLKLACALTGPAASGKASTVRALGDTVGAFVVSTCWCVVDSDFASSNMHLTPPTHAAVRLISMLRT